MKVFLYKSGDEQSHKELGAMLRALKKPEDKEGAEFIVTIKKKKHIRSIDQNAYYWAILTIIASDSGEYDRDRLHELMKKKFNGELIHLPKSPAERIGKSTGSLDSAEFTAYISRVKVWARDEFGTIIPEQKDTTYQVWAEIEDRYEKTFVG